MVVSFFIVDAGSNMRGRIPHFVLGRLPIRERKTLHVYCVEGTAERLDRSDTRHVPSHVQDAFRTGGSAKTTIRCAFRATGDPTPPTWWSCQSTTPQRPRRRRHYALFDFSPFRSPESQSPFRPGATALAARARGTPSARLVGSARYLCRRCAMPGLGELASRKRCSSA